MGNTDDLFVKEDISKPENRVNLALFSLMQQDWFREWILKMLCLPTDAVVYPPTNVHGRRPDLKAIRDGSELAMIEVELGDEPGPGRGLSRAVRRGEDDLGQEEKRG